MQHNSPLDSIFSRQIQGTSTQRKHTKKTLYNTVQLVVKMMHYIPTFINPLTCSNTGYIVITYSMIVYSPLCTTVSVALIFDPWSEVKRGEEHEQTQTGVWQSKKKWRRKKKDICLNYWGHLIKRKRKYRTTEEKRKEGRITCMWETEGENGVISLKK